MGEKLGILGPVGTHSEDAAKYLIEYLGDGRQCVCFGEIFDALRALEQGEVDAALVPVENSLEGSINITLDVLSGSDDLTVVRELIWPIHNFLMGNSPADKVKKIYSHAQPISQCRRYLREHYPKAAVFTTSSTSKAAQIAAEAAPEAGAAAICPERAGLINGLSVLAEEVQDNMNNSTRFFEIRRRDDSAAAAPPEICQKILVVCQIDGQKAGSLCEVLLEFSRRGINLTRIESRPARTRLGEYIFFFDLEIGANAENMRAAITAVRQKSIWLKEVGTFPVIVAADETR